jgi:chromosome segregation ATPase
MTTIGKILVVLHLVLSVMFLAFAGAVVTAQTNWRKAEGDAQKALAKAKSDLKDRQTESERQLADMAAKVAKLENDVVTFKGLNTALDTEVKTLTSDNKQLRKEVDQQYAQASLTTTEATERKKEADIQRVVNSDLYITREDLNKKLHDLEDKRFALELTIAQISDKYDLLLNDYKIMRQFLASKDLTTDPKQMVGLTAPAPPLDGKVLDVRKMERGGGELIEISLGSDAGLVVGNKLTAFNAKGYLGVIRLTLVEPDRSVGIVIASTRQKNAVFQVGDGVTTKY